MSRRRVLLFARYAELLGAEAVEVELPTSATAAQCIAALRTLPGGDLLPARPVLVRNHEVVAGTATLGALDELALLPPMAGG